MDELVYWLWLSLSCIPDTKTFARLSGKIGSPKEIFDADDAVIASVVREDSAEYQMLVDKDLSRAEEIYDFCKKKNVGILTFADPAFPESLRKIPTPPVLLYYRGVLPDFSKNFFVSVVGTRRLSDYGRKNAFSVARDLARAGATVVSGMAIGIDGVALAAAVSTGKPAVAVIGSGIDVCYPPEHQTLARAIVKNGCVLTEYAPGTKPDGYRFPKRNRLISGLSSATLIVEGNERSGAMITARHAEKQGRVVYALPGNVGNQTSVAPDLLIKNGAKLITAADDILHDFEFVFPGVINPFNLIDKDDVNMSEVLSEYRVSCVTPSDGIFRPSRAKIRRPASEEKTEEVKAAPAPVPDPTPVIEEIPAFDKRTAELYKKIPPSGECPIEDLVDEEYSLRDVMKILLSLEMGKFVTMLPGEAVKRNLS